MAALFAAVARDIDQLTDCAVQRIHAGVEEYAAASPHTQGDLWWSTRRNIQAALVHLAEQRPLPATDLAAQRALGVRAAQRGIPLDAVMHAFSLGYIVAWDALRRAADNLGQAAATALLDAAGPMWLSLERFTSAVASGHRDASAVEAEHSRRKALAFVDALRRWPGALGEAEQAAAALGIPREDCFVWAMFEASTPTPLDLLTLVLDSPGGVLGLATGGSLGPSDERALASELVGSGARHVGVGLARQGLAGARQSLLDAEQAHEVAKTWHAEPCLFRRDWFSCMVRQSADQLQDLLGAACIELAKHEVRETVSVFLDESGNLAAAAKRLYLHPNTVAYRLARLAQRTGIDVRTSQGVAHALAALALSPPTTALRTP